MTATAPWQGTAIPTPGRLVYTGQIGSAHRHRHAAAQLVLAFDGDIELRDRHGNSCRGQAALIPPGALHQTTGAAPGLMVFADAHGTLGRALAARVRDTGLPPDTAAAWAAAARPVLPALNQPHDPTAAAAAALAALTGSRAPLSDPPHPALRQALTLLPAGLGGPVRLEATAAAVGLSASRLGHLFSSELGLPFRPYVRWLRLQRAIAHARTGATLTACAHAAGFTDSAHLTRVCHDMFGLAPSHLTRTIALTKRQPVRTSPTA